MEDLQREFVAQAIVWLPTIGVALGLLILFLWIKEWKIQTTSLPAVEETQESLVTRTA